MTDKVCIYALREAGDPEVRYVGQTINPLSRIVSHRLSGDVNARNPKAAWIGSVISKGSTIDMEVLEECHIKVSAARESYWIHHYRQLGHRLTNVSPGMMNPTVAIAIPSDDGLIRTSTYLTEEQVDWLNEMALMSGKSIHEHIWKALNQYKAASCYIDGLDKMVEAVYPWMTYDQFVSHLLTEWRQEQDTLRLLRLVCDRLGIDTEAIDNVHANGETLAKMVTHLEDELAEMKQMLHQLIGKNNAPDY